jgi:hypothetical protein
MSDLLRKLIDESRDDLGKRELGAVDWDAVDRELFARVEQERRLERARAVSPRMPAWGVGAAVLAAAACFALVAGKAHPSVQAIQARSIEAPVVAAAEPPAGNVVGILGGGDLLIDGKPAAVGATLHLGNVIETRGTSVTVERPGKLSMILEAGTRATVTHVQGALVLALDTGAVEAQVVPVPSGEAFAVDVAGSRVAVHGTHLRVAVAGAAAAAAEPDAEHVVVDLSEGVVVIGAAPREGSTVGALVTAPAHAVFAPLDVAGTLQVTHEAAAVRPPHAIAAPAPSPALLGTVASSPVAPAPPRPAEPRSSSPVASPYAPNAAASPVARPAPPAAAPGPASAAAAPAADPGAAATLSAAVRSVVMTTLHVDLDADGNVRAARFDPPVAPDVNTCAAAAIYRTRFTHDGSADVPVEVTVPASSAP